MRSWRARCSATSRIGSCVIACASEPQRVHWPSQSAGLVAAEPDLRTLREMAGLG